jgi:hypothetical protein
MRSDNCCRSSNVIRRLLRTSERALRARSYELTTELLGLQGVAVRRLQSTTRALPISPRRFQDNRQPIRSYLVQELAGYEFWRAHLVAQLASNAELRPRYEWTGSIEQQASTARCEPRVAFALADRPAGVNT